ncbi:23S rRNA (cytidine1920-2'-O)/16S rRNA (cytidine1409-2'-O)-methyltransferase [Mumia flava]|uniref:23S rRNA (Cytidine1920-2'-O)/16S rRNA (Cytidine1409-2'-O)-methyltransferase n=1 Tax=Mumia flava TaxID=1348852 RepID=A0A0B2B448_9ACTN|nr:TlyA family RNA methyltransferase [Mumia flava]PJJ53361.1 23S rRNA (cytidine1920-2'-O)/16S rRNA (cytidine1409-2'-O)-methyltransferase [Mumia flava]
MSRRVRLDAELVRRGMARSRDHAGDLVVRGLVTVAGSPATKAATQVGTDQAIVVRDTDDPGYASRGAYKLLGALDAFEPAGLQVRGRRCLDAGASTGGFTDVLLRRDVAEVVAVDVGYGQLVWALRNDPRVVVLDRTNVRDLDVEAVGGPVDLVVSDLSFISLRLVVPVLAGLCASDGDLVLMVKPQFEVGRERVGKKGVVRDPALHVEAVLGVCESAATVGWGTAGVAASPLPGPSGNVEYFVWLRSQAGTVDPEAVRLAVETGPLVRGRENA